MGDTKDVAAPRERLTDESPEDVTFLAEAIAERRAVVYVGAGASVSAGLKSWAQLLECLAERAKPLIQDEHDREYLEATIKEHKHLEAADIVHETLGSDLEQLLWDLFAGQVNPRDVHPYSDHFPDFHPRQANPSDVHLHLARIPFSLAITTNFDQLLEKAYDNPPVLTWHEPDDLLRDVQLNRFVLLKTHGAIGKGKSVILTGANYQDLMHANPNFRHVMKVIFETKVCLFVGASLTDPDLVHLLQEISSDFSGLGHHYAFLPEEQAAPLRRAILYKNLRIKVIPFRTRAEDGQAQPDITAGLARKLRDLSGEVAFQRMQRALPPLPTSDEPDFFLKGALKQLLEQAKEVTGSFRGDVCLSSGAPGERADWKLLYAVHTQNTDPALRDADPNDIQAREVKVDSVCGIAYYKAKREGVYISDVGKGRIAEDLTPVRLYGDINYRPAHPEVRSELAVPIEADGLRIGVLNLESHLTDAYCRRHIEVAMKFAEKAGRLYSACNARKRRAKSLRPDSVKNYYRKLIDLFGRLWSLANEYHESQKKPIKNQKTPHQGPLALLVYWVDYEEGRLRAQNPNATIFEKELRDVPARIPCFSFSENSLAGTVFKEKRSVLYEDAFDSMNRHISMEYKDELEISGAIFGFPILVHGYVAGVGVGWRRRDPDPKGFSSRQVDLFRRAAHLIVNSRAPSVPSVEPPSSSGGAAIQLADRVLRWFSAEPGPESAEKEKLNALGEECQAAVGHRLLHLLQGISGAYREYESDDFIVPKRCRLWLRGVKKDGEEPAFALGLEVSFRSPHYRNVYAPRDRPADYRGVATRPAALHKPASPKKSAAGNDSPATVEGFRIGKKQMAVYQFSNDAHLGFLLSRVRADRFSKLQPTGALGTDAMEEILEKQPERPWYVTPLVVSSKDDWQNTFSETTEDRLVGYLTFDAGKAEEKDGTPQKGSREMTEAERALQNDLLHQLDLFSACLTTLPYTREFLGSRTKRNDGG